MNGIYVLKTSYSTVLMTCCSLWEDLLPRKSNLSDIFLTLICQHSVKKISDKLLFLGSKSSKYTRLHIYMYLVYPNTIEPVMSNCVCDTYIMYWETVLFSCKYTQRMGLWCTRVCICTCLCMRVFVFVCVCLCTHVYVCVHVYIYGDVCMYVYSYVLMYMYIYIFFSSLCLSSVFISHSL